MTGFEDREKAFEKQYAHQEKLGFDLEARCSKLYGLWAAEQIGLNGSDAQTYALEVVESNLEEPGFEDVLRKVKGDFEAKNIELSDHVMRTELDKALAEAKKQLSEKK